MNVLIFYKFIWVMEADMVLGFNHGKIFPGKKAGKHGLSNGQSRVYMVSIEKEHPNPD